VVTLDLLQPRLRQLKLSGMRDSIAARAEEARARGLDPLEFVQLLVDDELARREGDAVHRRIRQARFEDACAPPRASARRTEDTAPLGLTALPTDETVEVVDPTHPLYGLTLPLLGVTTMQQRLGRVCRVWLHPGVERAVPVAATDRGGVRGPPSPCRVSPAGLAALVGLLASLPVDVAADGEDAHAAHPPGSLAPGRGPAAGAAAGPPARPRRRAPAPPRLGPPVPPRRVWRSLGPPAQAAVRCAVVRAYQELCPELCPEAPEEVAHERRAARR
jgi:hypothetical protein